MDSHHYQLKDPETFVRSKILTQLNSCKISLEAWQGTPTLAVGVINSLIKAENNQPCSFISRQWKALELWNKL